MRPKSILLLVLVLAACGGEAPAGKAGEGSAAPATPPPAGIELRRGKDPQELVRIGVRGVVIGPAEGRLQRKLYADPRRGDDVWYLLSTYAPFESKLPAGDLVFRGRGKVKPGPDERRMIFEWVRQVASEAAGGRSGAAYGLVIAWHQGGASGSCDDVVLYLTGEAVATACGWDREVRGRLDPAQLGRVYGWFDRVQPFQAGGEQGEDSLRPGSFETRLIFAGRGARPATAAEQEEIQSFTVSLFAELAARRRGARPPAASAAPGKAVPESTPAPPAERLLLPPNAAVKPEEEILLKLPAEPPPVPKRAPSLPNASSPQPPLPSSSPGLAAL
jgi:hypothetical protein